MMRNVDVVIATEDGPLQVEAQLVTGLWATIYYKARFSVTHLPSGRAIFVTEDRLEAEGITVSLDKSFPKFRQGDNMTSEPRAIPSSSNIAYPSRSSFFPAWIAIR